MRRRSRAKPYQTVHRPPWKYSIGLKAHPDHVFVTKDYLKGIIGPSLRLLLLLRSLSSNLFMNVATPILSPPYSTFVPDVNKYATYYEHISQHSRATGRQQQLRHVHALCVWVGEYSIEVEFLLLLVVLSFPIHYGMGPWSASVAVAVANSLSSWEVSWKIIRPECFPVLVSSPV